MMFTDSDREILLEVLHAVRAIRRDDNVLILEARHMRTVTAALVAAVTALATASQANQASDAEALTLLQSIAGQLSNSDDPAIQAAADQVNTIATTLQANSTALHNAVATVAAELPATPVTPVTPPAGAPVIGRISPASPAGAAGEQNVSISGTKIGPHSTAVFTFADGTTAAGANQGATDALDPADDSAVVVSVDFGGQTGDCTVTVTDPDTGLTSAGLGFELV